MGTELPKDQDSSGDTDSNTESEVKTILDLNFFLNISGIIMVFQWLHDNINGYNLLLNVWILEVLLYQLYNNIILQKFTISI